MSNLEESKYFENQNLEKISYFPFLPFVDFFFGCELSFDCSEIFIKNQRPHSVCFEKGTIFQGFLLRIPTWKGSRTIDTSLRGIF